MSFKTLHQFTISIDREVKESLTRTEGGKEIIETSTVVKPVQVTILLKEPSRREKQDLSLFQDIEYGKAIDLGLLPRLVMTQKLARDSAGSLSGDEDKTLVAMNARIQELANDYVRLKAKTTPSTEEDNARMARLELEYNALQKRAVDLNSAYQSMFAHTAEQYRDNKALTWLALYLTYVKTGPDKQEPMFKGATFEAKEEALGDLEDAADPIYLASVQKLSTYMMLYFFGRASKSEDFIRIEQEWAKQEEAGRRIEAGAESLVGDDTALVASPSSSQVGPPPEVEPAASV